MLFAQEIVFFPENASTTASSVDNLLFALLAVCGTVGLGVASLLIGFAIRYRRRSDSETPAAMPGSTKLELLWTVTPLVIFLGFFVWGVSVYFQAFRAPDDATVIYGMGKQWMWKFQHPEGQREINTLHVPVGRPFKLLLTSEDVIHSFFVPDFRIHMDVLPGRYTSVWFEATKPGEFHLFCSQYCGTDHSAMIGKVIAMESKDYERWLDRTAEGSLALQGRKTFLKYRCLSCHSATAEARAPVLEELYGQQIALRDGGTVVVDEEYIRESILNPGRKIVAGFDNIMPTYEGQVSEEEIYKLIAFIKSLKAGETPERVEEFPAPNSTPQIEDNKESMR